MPSAYSALKVALNEICTNVAFSSSLSWVQGPMRHEPRGLIDSEERGVQPRAFEWRALGGNVEMPGWFLAKGRMGVNMLLRVAYPGRTAHDLDELDGLIGDDVEDISAALLDESNLPPSLASATAANIVLIGARDGGISTLPFDVLPLDGGGFVVEMQVAVIYERGPA